MESSEVKNVDAILGEVRRLQNELSAVKDQLLAQRDELERAKNESRHDFLTELPNRRAFEERLDELMARCERYGEKYVLVLVDIDRFKSFNDRFGHAGGDALLKAVGGVFCDVRRASDHVSRIGGDEFAILLTQTGLADCAAAVERYRKAIEKAPVTVEGRAQAVTASFGAAAMSPAETLERLRRRADEALYAAKFGGRNCICVHDGARVVPRGHVATV
jgi:diguanylate cyclase (GGDEF)-like protein